MPADMGMDKCSSVKSKTKSNSFLLCLSKLRANYPQNDSKGQYLAITPIFMEGYHTEYIFRRLSSLACISVRTVISGGESNNFTEMHIILKGTKSTNVLACHTSGMISLKSFDILARYKFDYYYKRKNKKKDSNNFRAHVLAMLHFDQKCSVKLKCATFMGS